MTFSDQKRSLQFWRSICDKHFTGTLYMGEGIVMIWCTHKHNIITVIFSFLLKNIKQEWNVTYTSTLYFLSWKVICRYTQNNAVHFKECNLCVYIYIYRYNTLFRFLLSRHLQLFAQSSWEVLRHSSELEIALLLVWV